MGHLNTTDHRRLLTENRRSHLNYRRLSGKGCRRPHYDRSMETKLPRITDNRLHITSNYCRSLEITADHWNKIADHLKVTADHLKLLQQFEVICGLLSVILSAVPVVSTYWSAVLWQWSEVTFWWCAVFSVICNNFKWSAVFYQWSAVVSIDLWSSTAFPR